MLLRLLATGKFQLKIIRGNIVVKKNFQVKLRYDKIIPGAIPIIKNFLEKKIKGKKKYTR